jgi:hypothetical protein
MSSHRGTTGSGQGLLLGYRVQGLDGTFTATIASTTSPDSLQQDLALARHAPDVQPLVRAVARRAPADHTST